MIEWKVVKKNRNGHRWIEEPVERSEFRMKCKFRDEFGFCRKGYGCYETHNSRHVVDTFRLGCSESVKCCTRLLAWDKKHGIEKPYTIVDRDGNYLRRNFLGK